MTRDGENSRSNFIHGNKDTTSLLNYLKLVLRKDVGGEQMAASRHTYS